MGAVVMAPNSERPYLFLGSSVFLWKSPRVCLQLTVQGLSPMQRQTLSARFSSMLRIALRNTSVQK